MTRGTSCNNPMNIMMTSVLWKGEVRPSRDPQSRLCTFDGMESGIRAGAKTLLAYYNLHDLKTVHGILERYAPSSENNTLAYESDVCQRLGVGADDVIDLNDAAEMCKLIKAIIHHEQGYDACDDGQIMSGVQRAYA